MRATSLADFTYLFVGQAAGQGLEDCNSICYIRGSCLVPGLLHLIRTDFMQRRRRCVVLLQPL